MEIVMKEYGSVVIEVLGASAFSKLVWIALFENGLSGWMNTFLTSLVGGAL